MHITLLLLAQLAATAPVQIAPVLSFPDPVLDDTVAYRGYQTRFFQDVAGNTVQIYLNAREGRAVHLLANADNESVGFTARDASGRPVPLRWAADTALISGTRDRRSIEYGLLADAPHVHLGWFLLGSMRVERDFQYGGRHRAPFAGQPFTLPEIDRLLTSLERLDPAERARHLDLLGASGIQEVRGRLRPRVTTRSSSTEWLARVIQPALDGRDTLFLELRADPRTASAAHVGDSLSLQTRGGGPLRFTVRVTTSARPLTPLKRDAIFASEFLDFLAEAEARATDARSVKRARWLERQVRGVELLSSREKLMAGLPAYATYFGRDMLVSALMMRSIWRDEMSEFVIASVLRKLSPSGEVSHEEALGGQAVREAASEYAALIDRYAAERQRGDRASAESLLARSRDVLRDLRRVRENYHMIDDEFQLPVLAARWLGDPGVSRDRKRAFLLDASQRERRLDLLLRELALVASMALPYTENPSARNLVSFPARDSARWAAASWRDSNAGYAGGRYGMDVNAIWVPHALHSIGRIFAALREAGISIDSLARAVPELREGTALGRFARDSMALRRAAETWWGASRHFIVRLGPAEIRTRVTARLSEMPPHERRYWTGVLSATNADRDSLEFLALSLDAQAKPIGVTNTDPATALFLGYGVRSDGSDRGERASALRDVRLFVLPYPVGLFIDGIGPVVANDAYAAPLVWQEFLRDHYHGPRVVWGREINLFLLGAADRIAATSDTAYARELRDAIERVMAAVAASGFRSELWSYEIVDSRARPVRYGTGSDVQLWSTTDLAVQFALWKLGL